MIILLIMRKFTEFKGLLNLLSHAPWAILAENDCDAGVCMEVYKNNQLHIFVAQGLFSRRSNELKVDVILS